MGPHVLLIVLDAARRDSLEPYGAAPGASPAIAQLAGRGKAHENVYSTACWTVPSHASMFTGLMPRAAGLAQVRSAPEAKPIVQSHRDRLLPEVMQRAGYRSLGVSANVWVSAASGYDTGFDPFVLVDSGRHARMHKDGAWERSGGSSREHSDAPTTGRSRSRRCSSGRCRRRISRSSASSTCSSATRPTSRRGRTAGRSSSELGPPTTRAATGRSTRSGAQTWEPRPSPTTRSNGHGGCTRRRSGTWTTGSGACSNGSTARGSSTTRSWSSVRPRREPRRGRADQPRAVTRQPAHPRPVRRRGPRQRRRRSTAWPPCRASSPRRPGSPTIPTATSRRRATASPNSTRRSPRATRRCSRRSARWGSEDALDALTTPLTCAVDGEFKLLRRGEQEEAYELESDPLELTPLDPSRLPDDRLAALRGALDHPAMTANAGAVAGADTAAKPSEEEMRDLEERMKLLGYL